MVFLDGSTATGVSEPVPQTPETPPGTPLAPPSAPQGGGKASAATLDPETVSERAREQAALAVMHSAQRRFETLFAAPGPGPLRDPSAPRGSPEGSPEGSAEGSPGFLKEDLKGVPKGVRVIDPGLESSRPLPGSLVKIEYRLTLRDPSEGGSLGGSPGGSPRGSPRGGGEGVVGGGPGGGPGGSGSGWGGALVEAAEGLKFEWGVGAVAPELEGALGRVGLEGRVECELDVRLGGLPGSGADWTAPCLLRAQLLTWRPPGKLFSSF